MHSPVNALRRTARRGRPVALAFVAAAVVAAPAGATPIGQNGRIAFSAAGDIYVVDPDGTGLHHLAFPGNDREPAFSPDGSRIAFTSDADGNDDVWIVDSDFSTAPVQLTDGGTDEHAPAFRPLADTIVYVRDSWTTGDGDLWTMTSAGSSQQQLTSTKADERDPAYSQSGFQLVFAAADDRGDPGDLLTMDANGANVQQLTSTPDDEREPTWFMGQIAFARAAAPGEPADLWRIAPDGTGLEQLSSDRGDETGPAGSPNGKKIAYIGAYEGAQHLLVGLSDGTWELPVPNIPAPAADPDWESVLELDLTGSAREQRASNVVLVPHGTSVEVGFDQAITADKPFVELWNGGIVHVQGGSGAAKKHWQIEVANLEPGTTYTVKIVMNDGNGGSVTYAHPSKVTTLQRTVSVTYRWVEILNDSDPGGCGEIDFMFRQQEEGLSSDLAATDNHSLCDGDTWDPADITVALAGVQTDYVDTAVLGVDNDDVCFVYCDVYPHSSWEGAKDDGEWAEGAAKLYVGPEQAEDWTKSTTISSATGNGDLSFVWHVDVSVAYS